MSINSVLQQQVSKAVEAIKSGGIIAYPTEAVYGLGCDPNNTAAINKLLVLKQRPATKGLILVAASIDQLQPFIQPLDTTLLQRILPTWPGPVTWLVPAHTTTNKYLSGDHKTIAVRVSDHPIIRALCEQANMAIVSTSANRSNQAPATSYNSVLEYFNEQIDYIIRGEIGIYVSPTEIRDALSGKIVRPSPKF